MALIDDEEIKDQVVRRLASHMSVRKSWEPHWREVAKYTQPRLGKALMLTGTRGGQNSYPSNDTGQTSGSSTYREGQEMNSRLLDDEGIWASQVMGNGMATGLTSAAMPWFKLGPHDPGLKKYKPVREWLSVVEDRLYWFFAKTAFYQAQKSSYLSLGVIGTSATLMSDSPDYLAVVMNLAAGEYWIGTDAAGVANQLYRRVDMTALQIKSLWPNVKLPPSLMNALNDERPQNQFVVYQAIEPNAYREPGKIDGRNKAFRSVYWLAQPGGGKDGVSSILSVGGFNERPFWAPRWDVESMEVYGRGPGMNALPALRRLQLQELRVEQGTDYAIKPALRGPTTLNNTHASLLPGRITTMASIDKDAFGPIWEVDARAIEMTSQRSEKSRTQVRRAFYADLFMAITNMPGIQPRNVEEIARRNEEQLSQLGPTVDRNINEQLRVAIDRAYAMMLRLDPALAAAAPPELHGTQLNVEFIGSLSQMQRAIGVGPIQQVLGFVGSLAGEYPPALDKVNIEKAIDEFSDRVGAPPDMIRDDQEVDKIRADRAKQQQAAQAIAAAPAAKDGAIAAQTLANTNTGSNQNLLQRVLGG